MKKLTQLACMLAIGLVAGCATHPASSVVFLGIPETESSDRGPVGLIHGQPCQIRNVSTVSETTYREYQTAKQAGRVFAEEMHGHTVYYAIKVGLALLVDRVRVVNHRLAKSYGRRFDS